MGLLAFYELPIISCCASNLTVNFSTILVGRAGEPVSAFNLDAPQLIAFIIKMRYNNSSS